MKPFGKTIALFVLALGITSGSAKPLTDKQAQDAAARIDSLLTADLTAAKLKPNATINVAASVSDPLSSDVAVEFRACAGSSCAWSSGSTLGTDETAPYNVSWQVPASGTHTLIARANDAGETLSEPVTVTVAKAKDDTPKKKKKKGKKGKKKKKR